MPYPRAAHDRTVVKEFVAELSARGLAAKSIANTVLVLRLVLQEAVEAGALRENPATGLRLAAARRQEPRFLTADEVNALVAATRAPYGFLILFAAYTGLRPSELCGLRVDKLDLLRRRVEVSETLVQISGETVIGPTKSDAVRSVPLPCFLRDEAGEYLALRRHQLGRPLAPTSCSRPSRPRTASPAPSSSTPRASAATSSSRRSPPPVSPATLVRAISATPALRCFGAHPRAIMERLGHSDITITLSVYGHLFPSLEEQLTDGLDELYRSTTSEADDPITATGESTGTVTNLRSDGDR